MIGGNKNIFGILITVTALITIRFAYEYGRYSAFRDIHKRGWAVVDTEYGES